MMRLLAVVLIAAGGAYWATHRGLTEGQVRGFYGAQVDAFGRQDTQALCAQFAPDFAGAERQAGPGGVRTLRADHDLACRNIDVLFGFKKKFDARQAGGDVLGTELSVAPGEITLAHDGKSADVRVHTHLNFGGALVSDGDSVEHLVLRGGKLLLAGSQADSRVSGLLAGDGPPGMPEALKDAVSRVQQSPQ